MYINSSTPQGQSNFYKKIASQKLARGNQGFTRKASVFGYGTGSDSVGMPPVALSGGQVSRMAMKPFSPLYQESNLMLPKDRKTMNAYNRHYYETDYWVGNIIDLHTYYPLGGFDIISKNKDLEHLMIRAADRVDLLNIVLGVGLEYWVYGEAFPFLEWDKNTMMWSRATIFNPDLMEVRRTIFMDKPIITLIPDAELKRIVTSTHPADAVLREQIPRGVLEYVLKGENIPLSSRNISHILKKTVPHDLRGTSIIQRVWKELMLRDAFREVLFVIAQNHITPLKIFKIGGVNKEYYPSSDELAIWQGIIEEAQNDPNFSIITHEGLEVDYKGATGQILDVHSYLEQIQNNVLTGLFASKAMTSGDGPCYDCQTEVLTENGWKKYEEVLENERIAVFDPETHKIDYELPEERHYWLNDGKKDMIHFKTQHIDVCVTADHNMHVLRDGKWIKIPAQEVSLGDKFCGHLEWESPIEPKPIVIGDKIIDPKIWMKFLGYFISEGYISYNKSEHENGPTSSTYQICIPQSKLRNPETFIDIEETLKAMEFTYSITEKSPKGSECYDFIIYSKELVEYLEELFDVIQINSYTKYIPQEYLMWPKEYLSLLLQALMSGDRHIRYSHKKRGHYYAYATCSEKLADSIQELILKVGYLPTKKWDPYSGTSGLWRVYYSTNSPDIVTPGLASAEHIKKLDGYKDYVWCFKMPSGAFITRRNGKIGTHFNTYANAQVAYEILQKRYVYFRNVIERWLKNKFFLPISIMHGFKNKEGGYDVPQIKWSRMDFNKDDAWRNKVIELNQSEKKLISDRTVVTELGFDYDEQQELIQIERIAQQAQKEKAKAMAKGEEGGAGGLGGLGGLGGGLGDLGGGLGGLGGGGGLEGLGGEGGGPELGGLGGGLEGLGGGGEGPESTAFGTPGE
jgi:hypothetical protein